MNKWFSAEGYKQPDWLQELCKEFFPGQSVVVHVKPWQRSFCLKWRLVDFEHEVTVHAGLVTPDLQKKWYPQHPHYLLRHAKERKLWHIGDVPSIGPGESTYPIADMRGVF
jgi:hypothetical protein